MKIKRYATMVLVIFLTAGILLLFGGGLTLAGAQQAQPGKAGTPSAPANPQTDKEIQNPNAPVLQPSAPDAPAPDKEKKDKDREYETQC